MLFCRKCGAQVKRQDMFCTNCLTRLDTENSVISKQEYSSTLPDNGEFNPDSVITDLDLSGNVIMNHRLLQKIGTFAGATYYQAKHIDNADENTVVIRHIVFPDDLSRGYSLVMRRLDKAEDHRAASQFAADINSERAAFQSRCVQAQCGCLNYNSQSFYSELYEKFHIFIMMKHALPLPYYALMNDLTLREALEIMHSVCEQILKLRKRGINYGSFSDEMIFVGKDGSVFLDFCQGKHYGQYYPYSPVYQHYMQFAAPGGADPEVYSAALILFYLISGYRHPYVNPNSRSVSGRDLIMAERKRIVGEKTWIPTLAGNMLGNAITGVLERSARSVSLEEFERVIWNAFNYLTADELNSRISEQ